MYSILYTIIDSMLFNILLFIAGGIGFLHLTYWLVLFIRHRPHVEVKITPKGNRYFTIEPPRVLVAMIMLIPILYFLLIAINAVMKIIA